jgi:hypothetical protein
MLGEAASTDITAANEFPIHFQKLVDEEKLTPDLVFNVDETGLYWKSCPTVPLLFMKNFCSWVQGSQGLFDFVVG